MFAFGDVILARFPFTDLSGDKRRPALVVSKASSGGDYIVCFITSVPRSGAGTIAMDPTRANGLKQRSTVCFNKIATLNEKAITGRLGAAPAEWLYQHAPAFHGVFGFVVPGTAPNAL